MGPPSSNMMASEFDSRRPRMKTWILSTPKSGTHYVTNLLRACGVEAAHEACNWGGLRVPEDSFDVDVSGFLPAFPELMRPDDDRYFLVRDPVKVINSWAIAMQNIHGGSTYFNLWKAVAMPHEIQLGMTWAYWVHLALRHVPKDNLIHVEDRAELLGLCNEVSGERLTKLPEIKYDDTGASKEKSYLYGWDDLPSTARELASALGYGSGGYET